MTNTDKNRADFEAWLPPYDPLPIIKERMLEAYRAGREAERAESVTDAEPVRAALEAAHKLLQPRLGEPDRTVFWLVVDALHDLKFWGEPPPKPEAVTGAVAVKLYRIKAGGGSWSDWSSQAPMNLPEGVCMEGRVFYANPPKPEPSPDVDYFASLVGRARTAAAKATAKFPQPNYVTLKIAEEAGEVVRGAVHFAEGRMPWDEVEGEIVQLLAMLIRFVTEGDQINGVTPPVLTKPEGR